MSKTRIAVMGELAEQVKLGKCVYLGSIAYDVENDQLTMLWNQEESEAVFSRFFTVQQDIETKRV